MTDPNLSRKWRWCDNSPSARLRSPVDDWKLHRPGLIDRGGEFSAIQVRIIGLGSLMNNVAVALVFLVRRVTKLAPLRVVRVPFFGEILLRGYCEHKLLVTFTADEDARFKPALH